MKWTSIIAIYCLFWVMSVFFVLPFGVRTHDEAGVTQVRGQAESAPVQFSFALMARRATAVSVILFGIYYANYGNGWVTLNDINWWSPR